MAMRVFVLILAVAISPSLQAGLKQTLLTDMPGFPPVAAEVLAEFGVRTDRDFLVAGISNPDGVAKALSVEVEGLKKTVRSLWGDSEQRWVAKWATSCRDLLYRGRPKSGFLQTPLLALPMFPVDQVRKLCRLGIPTAERFYVRYALEPEVLLASLQVSRAELQTFVDAIEDGAPHVTAMIDRVTQGKQRWNIRALLE